MRLRVGAAATRAEVRVNGRRIGEHLGAWTPFEFDLTPHVRRGENELEIECADVHHATNGFLPWLGMRWTGARDVQLLRGEAPSRERPAAASRCAVHGTQLRVDGRPFRVRGVLHWGYYPELGRPWPSERTMREEIGYFASLGFNLIKFCLWIPPPRYYELCGEMGMFVWQEYPVWAEPLAGDELRSAYDEYFRQDAGFDCIILRTLTCENDRIDPELARELVELARRRIPGCVILDNSAWLCAERVGDFHDEHPYLHNAQWKYYPSRMRARITKPLLLGETMAVAGDEERGGGAALEVRRYQIETLGAELPDAGYVLNSARDLPGLPVGLQTLEGRPKHTADEWAWHRDELAAPRWIPDACGPIIGPRKGEWKCPEFTWWSPVIRVLATGLPTELIEREAAFELLSGRRLENTEGARVLVEAIDHYAQGRRTPLVIEFETRGERRVVSALRHDTPAGREVWRALCERRGGAPEIGEVKGTSIVLEDWRMATVDDDRRTTEAPRPAGDAEWVGVKCDTPLVNGGRNVFEGAAWFRTLLAYPGGAYVLRCESVGDYWELHVDGRLAAAFGPRHGTWDGTRDIPRDVPLDLPAGDHVIEMFVRDWRGAGGLVGPVYLRRDATERVF